MDYESVISQCNVYMSLQNLKTVQKDETKVTEGGDISNI